MARYINADALMEKCLAKLKDGEVLYRISPQEIDEFPTADVVEVVRCSECVNGKKAVINDKGFKICPVSGMEITDTDYCSYGERRTDDGNL